MRQTIQGQDNSIQAIQYDNMGLQGEIRAKDQHITALQRRYVGYLSNEDKNNGINLIVKNNEEAGYPYISIWGQHGYRRHRPGCCWHVIKVAPCLRMEIHRIPLSRITSGKTIG